MTSKSNKTIVITSGYFNPLHIGHVNLMKEAKKLGDFLVVIVNNDKQVKLKGSVPFMPEEERFAIVEALGCVDEVFLSIDSRADDKVPIPKTLEAVVLKYPNSKLIFAKGGDRNLDNLPESEKEICKKYNIKVISNVGGEKVQSSSWLISNSIKSKK